MDELCFGERKTQIICYREWRTENLVGERRERSYPELEKEQKEPPKSGIKLEIFSCFRELFVKLLLFY